MNFDFNGVSPQSRSLIPDGTYAKVTMTLIPGGTDGDSPKDLGLLLASKNPATDYVMLDAQFSVVGGPHAGRQFWQKFGIRGGDRTETGAFKCWLKSQALFRAMIDSAHGLDPNDYSEAARRKRVLGGLADLNQLSFVVRIRIQPNTNPAYKPSNKIGEVILPTVKEWSKVMAGETLTPSEPARRGINDGLPDIDPIDVPF